MDREALARLSSQELLELHRRECDDEDSNWDALWALRDRGGAAELEMGLRLVASDRASDRGIGASLLGQLGSGAPVFVSESVDALLGLLDDPNEDVLASAIFNLGHRRDARALPGILRFAGHPSPAVRHAVSFALGHFDEPLASSALVGLVDDADFDTRNWAVFGLGTQMDSDTPEIRDAFVRALGDADLEVRGEALVGLARRGDGRTAAALLDEWKDGSYSMLSLDAAEELGDPALVPRLNELLAALAGDDDEDEWRPRLERAIAACQSGPIEQADRAGSRQLD